MIANTSIDIDIKTSNKPCFFNAIKLLLETSQKYLNNNLLGVLFLEDDWHIDIESHQSTFYNYINNINTGTLLVALTSILAKLP